MLQLQYGAINPADPGSGHAKAHMQNAHAHAHGQLFPKGGVGWGGKDSGSGAAPLTLARGYQDLKDLRS